jgi:hypothetical protein
MWGAQFENGNVLGPYRATTTSGFTTGSMLDQMKFNLKNTGSFSGSYFGNWNGGYSGNKPDGVSAYINTGLNISRSLVETNIALSIYSTTNSTKEAWDIGGRNFGFTNPIGILSNYGTITYAAWGNYDSQIPGVNTSAFFTLSKNATTLKLFRNTSNIINATKTLSTLPDENILIGSTQQATNGSYGNYSDKQYAFATIGDGLTDYEAKALYWIVQKYQTTLGRQVY